MNHVFKTIHKKMKGFANTTVVVSENASSLSKATDNRSVLSRDIQTADIFTVIKQALSVSMASLLFVGSLQADIIADKSAPITQQPTILLTNSGATQINIQTPTSGGVSMNQYTKFDTKSNGTIINNSRTNINTVAAGWVQGNPWLANGSAKVIVNQVNSSNPSSLTGNIEIAGSKADFIIANPSGISIDGATIINAGGTTLTTGTPLLNNGNIDGFSINNGIVSIQGSGLNALGSDYTNILARAAIINAGIWANELKIITGTNTISADSTNIVANTPNTQAPLLAIDSSVFGGMYANKITLVGTENGVGINNAGAINASTIAIDANGMLTNRGLIDGSQTTVKANTINNIGTGKIFGDSLALQATTLNNTNETMGGISNSATIEAIEELDIGANIINNTNRSTIASLGDMYIGGSLDENGLATGKANEIKNLSATIESMGNMFLSSDQINNIDTNLITKQVIDSTVYTEYVNPVSGSGAGEWFLASDCYGILGKQDDNYFGVSEEMAKRDAMLQDYMDNNYNSYKNIISLTQGYNNSAYKEIADYNLRKNNTEYSNLSKIIDAAASEDYTILREYITTSHTELVFSDPAEIISGGDMIIDGLLHNKDSHVIAGGTILTSQNPENLETKGQDIISFDGSTIQKTTVESDGWGAHKREWHGKASYDLADIYSELYTLGSNQDQEDPKDQINGALISASSIVTTGSNDLFNNGTIMADNVISLNSAGSINSNTGNMKADSIVLRADDININRGNVQANNAMVLDAKNNINIASQTYSTSNTDGKSSFSRTGMQNNANIAVNNSDGLLLVNAGNNINLNGANLTNNGILTQFQAGNDINLGTIQTSEQNNVIWDSKNHRIEGYSHEVGNTIQTNGDNTIIAGNDINVIAGTIDSLYGTTALMAINNINILSGTDTSNYDEATYIKTSSLLGTKKTTTIDTKNTTTSQGSYVGGDQVLIASGNDLMIQGGVVISDNGTVLSAKNDISILSPTDTVYQTYFNEVKKSGLFSDGGLSVTLGNSMNSIDSDNSYTMLNGSMVGSLNGGTVIVAGNNYHQVASSVLSGHADEKGNFIASGDTSITAKKIDIKAGYDMYGSSNIYKSKQSGLTIALDVPVVNAVKDVVASAIDIGESKNTRVNAMAAANTAIDAYQAKNAIGALKGLSDVTSLKDAASVTSASLSVTVGSSKSKSTTTDEGTNVVSSTVGGKNVTIKAIGDNSDINVVGSNISGTSSTKLISDHDINIIAAANYDEQHSTDKSSGWNAGAVISTEAVGATFGGNVGKGNADGVGTTYTNSHIGSLSSSTTINAGDTTNIIGGQITGNKVKLIASDLNIESLQDTAIYDSQQKNISGQITVGSGWGTVSGSANKSNIDANYASVNEQSGIIAGDKGYDVSVVNNTNMVGGIITSTQLAEDNNLNSFSTGTLTLSNIDNYSSYEGDSVGLSGSVGFSNPNATTKTDAIKSINTPLSTTTKSIGYGSDSYSQTSTTYAGINTSNITISDAEGQLATGISAEDIIAKAHTDITAYTLEANSGALANTFDAAAVQHELDVQTRVTQEFNENALAIINAYVDLGQKEAKDKIKDINNQEQALNDPNNTMTDEEKKTAYDNLEAQKTELYDDIYNLEYQRIALSTISSMLTMGDIKGPILYGSLQTISTVAREESLNNSRKFTGIIGKDAKGNTIVISNVSEESGAFDGVKLGGTRLDLDAICGENNERCRTYIDADGNKQLDLDYLGRVQWIGNDTHNTGLDAFMNSNAGKEMSGITGGVQGIQGTMGFASLGLAYDYAANGLTDWVVDTGWAGIHDWFGGEVPGLYDDQGNTQRGMSQSTRILYDSWSIVAVGVTAPIAISNIIPYDVFKLLQEIK